MSILAEKMLNENKHAQGNISKQVATPAKADAHDYSLEAEALRLTGEEQSLKNQLYGQRVAVYRHGLVAVDWPDGKPVYRAAPERSWLATHWRFTGMKDGQFRLSGGGQVVGNIPAGLPGLVVPSMDFGVVTGLLGTAFIMALIGFIEATSISGALAAKSREISRADIQRSLDAARSVPIPSEFEILHVLPREFVVDGQDGVWIRSAWSGAGWRPTSTS